ncbi:MAG: hypothetical protein IT323_14715 [Anaerolineae bacterium]|nr:hypothetical protein [Anaerolineae bacterium]
MSLSAEKYRLAEAQKNWRKARSAALWARLNASLDDNRQMLLDFNEVSRRLHLRNTRYRGLQSIPLDQIVGSMGRYRDFTRTFLPLHNSLRPRWESLAAFTLSTGNAGFPAIEVFKAGHWYFVKDGNHRCSVARQFGFTYIDAIVLEFTDCIPDTSPDEGIEGMLLRAEEKEFLESTRLDETRPDHGIRLTQLGGYTDILSHIESYREALGRIDEADFSLEDAAAAWYDILYESIVQLVREEGVLSRFPHRTEADFFVWLIRHRDEIAQMDSGPAHVHGAALVFRQQHTFSLFKRLRLLLHAFFTSRR